MFHTTEFTTHWLQAQVLIADIGNHSWGSSKISEVVVSVATGGCEVRELSELVRRALLLQFLRRSLKHGKLCLWHGMHATHKQTPYLGIAGHRSCRLHNSACGSAGSRRRRENTGLGRWGKKSIPRRRSEDSSSHFSWLFWSARTLSWDIHLQDATHSSDLSRTSN